MLNFTQKPQFPQLLQHLHQITNFPFGASKVVSAFGGDDKIPAVVGLFFDQQHVRKQLTKFENIILLIRNNSLISRRIDFIFRI